MIDSNEKPEASNLLTDIKQIKRADYKKERAWFVIGLTAVLALVLIYVNWLSHQTYLSSRAWYLTVPARKTDWRTSLLLELRGVKSSKQFVDIVNKYPQAYMEYRKTPSGDLGIVKVLGSNTKLFSFHIVYKIKESSLIALNVPARNSGDENNRGLYGLKLLGMGSDLGNWFVCALDNNEQCSIILAPDGLVHGLTQDYFLNLEPCINETPGCEELNKVKLLLEKDYETKPMSYVLPKMLASKQSSAIVNISVMNLDSIPALGMAMYSREYSPDGLQIEGETCNIFIDPAVVDSNRIQRLKNTVVHELAHCFGLMHSKISTDENMRQEQYKTDVLTPRTPEEIDDQYDTWFNKKTIFVLESLHLGLSVNVDPARCELGYCQSNKDVKESSDSDMYTKYEYKDNVHTYTCVCKKPNYVISEVGECVPEEGGGGTDDLVNTGITQPKAYGGSCASGPQTSFEKLPGGLEAGYGLVTTYCDGRISTSRCTHWGGGEYSCGDGRTYFGDPFAE